MVAPVEQDIVQTTIEMVPSLPDVRVNLPIEADDGLCQFSVKVQGTDVDLVLSGLLGHHAVEPVGTTAVPESENRGFAHESMCGLLVDDRYSKQISSEQGVDILTAAELLEQIEFFTDQRDQAGLDLR